MTAENKVREQYDARAQTYDARWRPYLKATLGTLADWIKPTGREIILDIACGTGELERLLLALHPDQRIAGVDISEKMLAVARRKLESYPNITFQKASASKLPFESDIFDIAVCASSFHYFDNPEACLAEAKRVLKPGGRIIVLDWCKDYLVCRLCDALLPLFDASYKRCYTQEELRRFLEAAGLRVRSEHRFRFQVVWGVMIAEAVK